MIQKRVYTKITIRLKGHRLGSCQFITLIRMIRILQIHYLVERLAAENLLQVLFFLQFILKGLIRILYSLSLVTNDVEAEKVKRRIESWSLTSYLAMMFQLQFPPPNQHSSVRFRSQRVPFEVLFTYIFSFESVQSCNLRESPSERTLVHSDDLKTFPGLIDDLFLIHRVFLSITLCTVDQGIEGHGFSKRYSFTKEVMSVMEDYEYNQNNRKRSSLYSPQAE